MRRLSVELSRDQRQIQALLVASSSARPTSSDGSGDPFLATTFVGAQQSHHTPSVNAFSSWHLFSKHGVASVDGDFQAFVEQMAEEFNELKSMMDLDGGWSSLRTTPAMDMREDSKSYIVLFNAPEARVEDINVELNGRLLQVRYLPTATDLHGRNRLNLSRRIWLPGPVPAGKEIYTSLSNGILKIVVPKLLPTNEGNIN